MTVQLGKLGVVIDTAGLIVTLYEWVAVLLAESVTPTVKLKGLPVVVEGVPVIAPVELLRVNPVGRLPAVTAKV